jgi:photosystem II stability/assembly factor-like uncharacterized protein
VATRAKQSTRAEKKRAARERAAAARQEQQRRDRRRRAGIAAGTVAAVVAVAVAAVWVSRDTGGTDGQASIDGFTHVHGLEAPAWAPEVVYLSTHQGLIRIADDRWAEVSEQPHDFMGFAAHPTEPDVLYSSGHPAPGSLLRNPIGFMVSVDGGASWEVRSLEGMVDFHTMSVGAAGEAIYGWNVSGDVGLYRSTDDGHTWQTVAAAQLHDAGGALTLAAHPEDPDEVWAGTPAGLFRSQDAGTSWEPAIGEVPVTAVAFDPADPSRVLAYAPAPREGLLESADAGQSWTPTGWMLEADDDAVGHLAIHPDDPQQLYAGTYGEDVYRSPDSGRTWQPLASSGSPE